MGDTPYRGPGSTGPIIIHTPQPDKEERLVRIPADCIDDEPGAHEVSTTHAYNATPADLERAGWVPRSALDTQVEATLSNIRHAGHLERERDEARCLYEAAHCERMRITDVLQRVERERDEARAALVKWQGSAEQERARCVAWLRAEAASSDWASCATWGRALSDTADRLERGDHAGTPAPAALPRATDEELFAAYQTAYIVSCGVKDPSEDQRGITRVMPAERKGIAAVAARVRREQCLVTRAVEAGALFSMRPYGGGWVIMVSHGANHHRETVPAADVPATLARLLGEVAR